MQSGSAVRPKRLTGILMSAVLTLTAVQPAAIPASAATSCGPSATWSFSNGVLTFSGTGAVSAVNWGAYSEKTQKVVIEKGITAMPAHSFDNFVNMTEMKMADSVETLGSFYSYNCPALKTLKLSESLKEIPFYGFYFCNSLTELNLPSHLVTVGENAFYGGLALTALTLPDSITTASRTPPSSVSLTDTGSKRIRWRSA